jgi:hypothetical protein
MAVKAEKEAQQDVGNLMSMFVGMLPSQQDHIEAKVSKRLADEELNEGLNPSKKEQRRAEILSEEMLETFSSFVYKNLTGPQFFRKEYWIDKAIGSAMNVLGFAAVGAAAVWVNNRAARRAEAEGTEGVEVSQEEGKNPFATITTVKASDRPARTGTRN